MLYGWKIIKCIIIPNKRCIHSTFEQEVMTISVESVQIAK
jgi:hypothetical protein